MQESYIVGSRRLWIFQTFIKFYTKIFYNHWFKNFLFSTSHLKIVGARRLRRRTHRYQRPPLTQYWTRPTGAPDSCTPVCNLLKKSSDLEDENKMLQLHWETENLLHDNNFPSRDPIRQPIEKKDLEQRCTNSGCQIAQATKFCIVVPNICQSQAQRLLHVTFLVPRILRWSTSFWETSASLLYNITATSACSMVVIQANYVAIHCNIYCITLCLAGLALSQTSHHFTTVDSVLLARCILRNVKILNPIVNIIACGFLVEQAVKLRVLILTRVSWQGKRFYFFQKGQTGSGFHSTFYSMGAGETSSQVKPARA